MLKVKKFASRVFPHTHIGDPTGVGDAFRGGFLTGLPLRLDWETCGQMGSLAATYCLEEKGHTKPSFTHLRNLLHVTARSLMIRVI